VKFFRVMQREQALRSVQRAKELTAEKARELAAQDIWSSIKRYGHPDR